MSLLKSKNVCALYGLLRTIALGRGTCALVTCWFTCKVIMLVHSGLYIVTALQMKLTRQMGYSTIPILVIGTMHECYVIWFRNTCQTMNGFDTIKSLNEVPRGSLYTNIVILNSTQCLYFVLDGKRTFPLIEMLSLHNQTPISVVFSNKTIM